MDKETSMKWNIKMYIYVVLDRRVMWFWTGECCGSGQDRAVVLVRRCCGSSLPGEVFTEL